MANFPDKDIEEKLKKLREFITDKMFNDALTQETELLHKVMEDGKQKSVFPKLIVKGFGPGMKPQTVLTIIDVPGDIFIQKKHEIIRQTGRALAKDKTGFSPSMVFIHSEV